MSSIAHTPPNRFNLRALLAGGTATGSLVAATVIAFLSLAVYVGFDGLPFGGDADSGNAISLGPPIAGAPEDAAAAAAGVPGAVAATPAAATAIAPAPGTVAGAPAGESPRRTQPPATTPPGGTIIVQPPGNVPRDPDKEQGALGSVVADLEGTTDLPLSDATEPLTTPLDETTRDTLNGVGGLLGNPELGDDVTDGVRRLSGTLLSPDGLAGRLVP